MTSCYVGKNAFEQISIHALREEGDRDVGGGDGLRKGISIHALREEGDDAPGVVSLVDFTFLSTPSARRATSPSKVLFTVERISIHALREEGDSEVNH